MPCSNCGRFGQIKSMKCLKNTNRVCAMVKSDNSPNCSYTNVTYKTGCSTVASDSSLCEILRKKKRKFTLLYFIKLFTNWLISR